jgi:CRP-like cAMP-binding protein
MAEVDPAILAERVLRLCRTHPFDAFSVGNLTILAAAGREVTCSSRTRLAAEGEPASAHWVALTGGLHAFRRDEPLPDDSLKNGFGVLSVLSGLPLPCDLVAEAGTVLFVLDADALFETLEEHGRLARTVLRELARSVLAARGAAGESPPSPVAVVSGPPVSSLDLVGRMMLLRSALGLQVRNAAVLTRLARASRPRRLAKGKSLWPEPGVPADLVVIVEGAVGGLPDDAGGVVRGPGAMYGLLEALASVPPERPALATMESTALVVSHAEIQEALDDDDRVCLALIRLAAADLWSAYWERHPLPTQ